MQDPVQIHQVLFSAVEPTCDHNCCFLFFLSFFFLFFFFFFFFDNGVFIKGLYIWPVPQPVFVLGLSNYLPRLALNHNPPDLCS
jgi:hypothetical protein